MDHGLIRWFLRLSLKRGFVDEGETFRWPIVIVLCGS